MVLAIGFFFLFVCFSCINVLYQNEEFLFCSWFLQSYYHDNVANAIKCFSAVTEVIISFSSHSVDVVNYIARLSHAKTTLHSSDKFLLVIYYSFLPTTGKDFQILY